MDQVNVAVFGKFPDVYVQQKIAPKLLEYGIHVVKNYDVTRVRNAQLGGVDACVYMFEMSSHGEFDRGRRLAEKKGKPIFPLPRKEAGWKNALSFMFKHLNLASPWDAPPSSPQLELAPEPPKPLLFEPQTNRLVPMQQEEEPIAEPVPEPPASGTSIIAELVPSSVGSVHGDERQYAVMLEEEIQRLRQLIDKQQDLITDLGLRLRRAETLRTGTLIRQPMSVPDNAVEAMRTLAQLGALDAMQLCDVIAHLSPRATAA